MDHLLPSLKISLAQFSDKGIKEENQDTIGARIPEGSALATKGIAVAIADGVSSSDSAKQASQSAICGFLTDYYATPDTWRTQQSAIRVIHSLNQSLWGQSRNSVREEGYLTTFSCLILKGDSAFVFHVGDTRVYRLRDGNLEQLTRDHTQKIDKNTTYLSRALGADPALEIDMFREEAREGDLYILSSDGIHDTLSHRQLELILQGDGDIEARCQEIAKLAIESQSKDNLSIQIVEVEATGSPTQQDAVTVLSQLPFPPPLEVGQKIDGLRVEQVLHESERSQVYLVRDEANRAMVMKTPSDNYSDDPAYIERFVMESWIGARIQNSHVVRVLPPPSERSFLYYLTEHIPGPTLAQLIKERAPFNIPDAIEILEQIIKGIRAFHRKDTLHQDIKPENIVIGQHGATIIDFGSCWVAGVEEATAPIKRDKILGTLRYSAPEYRYGGSVGQHSDQFSLAAILYEMLTGKLPYGGRYENSHSDKQFRALKYQLAHNHNPLVPFWLDKALEKALNIDSSERYHALSEWLQDLKRPNPSWSPSQHAPIFNRNPLLVWKSIAALGWISAVLLFINQMQ